MIAIVSFLVALVCLAASARRLHFVHTATAFDVEVLVRELRGDVPSPTPEALHAPFECSGMQAFATPRWSILRG